VPELITKLIPSLHVKDPNEERRFYEQLGLRTIYAGPEYPDFIAVGNDAVEFGLSRALPLLPHVDARTCTGP
jgi:hypothetical protein